MVAPRAKPVEHASAVATRHELLRALYEALLRPGLGLGHRAYGRGSELQRQARLRVSDVVVWRWKVCLDTVSLGSCLCPVYGTHTHTTHRSGVAAASLGCRVGINHVVDRRHDIVAHPTQRGLRLGPAEAHADHLQPHPSKTE